MAVTEPSINEILHVAGLANNYLEYAEDHDGVDDPTDWEYLVVNKVKDWAGALENLSKDDVVDFALAVLAMHNKSHHVEPCLTISTSHLDIETAKAINGGETYDLVMYDKGDYGWWFYVADLPENIVHEAPESLLSALTLAQSMNCVWLCLDQGAEAHPSLETYEW